MRLLSLLEGDGERQRLRGTVSRVGPSGVTTVALARGARLPTGKALCEVEYPNGVVVRVTSDMTLDQLRQMVTLLR